MELEKKFWKNKNVLITGNTGFKGSWLSMWLNSLGANVFGLGLLPQKKNDLFNLLNLQKDNNCSFSDIRNKDECKNIIKSADPEIIIHLAAQVSVVESVVDPIADIRINAEGTLRMCMLAKKHNCKLIYSSTNKVYGGLDGIKEPIKDTQPINPETPYGISKAAGAHYVLDMLPNAA